MIYEEIKEIKNRLELLEAPILSIDARLDNTSTEEYPEFYYYNVQVKVGEENDEVRVIELLINEDPTEEEIQLKKCNYYFIDEKYEQEQEKIYDACKQIVRDYLNGDLVKVVEEWKNL